MKDIKAQIIRHRMSNTRFYGIWVGMKQRCFNKKCTTYCNYGQKGIKTSDDWLTFINFKNDMYESYQNHAKEFGESQTTLDRIDSKGNYCKENCRWATYSKQINNTKINNKNKSGYKGVCWRKIDNKRFKKSGWRSYLIIGEKHIELGMFSSKKEALETRNDYIIKNNLPNKVQEYLGE